MKNEALKWVGGAIAGGAWLYLVMQGKADAKDFVFFIQSFLVGIGAYGLTVSGRNKE